jgi:hypothetical protein
MVIPALAIVLSALAVEVTVKHETPAGAGEVRVRHIRPEKKPKAYAAPSRGAATGQAAEASAFQHAQDLYLRVSTHHGYLPLAVDLEGELRNIDLTTIESCTLRVDRTYVTPSGMKLEERKDHPCVEQERTKAAIAQKFTRELLFQEPGDYLVRIMLTPRDGRPIAGMTHPVHPVQVFKAPIEVKAVTTLD